MKIILISYPEKIKDEHLLINALFEAGLEILHLRKPSYPKEELISLLDMIDCQYHKRIVLHSHYELCEGLKGIHFNAKSIHLLDNYKNIPIHKSNSCHSFQEVKEYNKTMNYSFISPVFDSISKKNYKSNILLNELEENANKFKLVALGGIDLDKIKQLKTSNLYGIALLGYIWKNENTLKAFKDMQLAVQAISNLKS